MARILFNDPLALYDSGDENLKDGICALIRKARNSIKFHSYSFAGFYKDDDLNRTMLKALRKNVELEIYGHKYAELNYLKTIYDDYNIACYKFLPPNEKCLYHIKALVVDDLYVYIGSANFSENAFNNSSELGLFFEDGGIARSIDDYVKHLQTQNLFEMVK